MEFSKFGRIDALHVCDNLGEYLSRGFDFHFLFPLRVHLLSIATISSQKKYYNYFIITTGDHMIGHVYCKFTDEEDASDALQVMDGRYYDGRKMEVEFSPVQNFQEVRKGRC